MSHLPAERLAALADDATLHPDAPRDAAPATAGGTGGAVAGDDDLAFAPATAEERAHLAACAACAGEWEAHRALIALAADERARLAPPLTAWGAIAAQLREEGLLGGVSYEEGTPGRYARVPALACSLTGDATLDDLVVRPNRQTATAAAAAAGVRRGVGRSSLAGRWGMRAAAAVLLAAGGAVAGRASVGGARTAGGLPSFGIAASQVARDSVAVASSAGAGITRLVSDSLAAFRSTTDALVALARAERDYQIAAAYLLAHDSSAGGGSALAAASGADSSAIYRARLAALDNVMAASREALYEAPHDPVINRYYLATVGAREATLQQLNTALPAGARLTRF